MQSENLESYSESKPIVWLSGEVKTPPFSQAARIEAGCLLRQLQSGEMLSMPVSRPMPSIGKRCHELRINDSESNKEISQKESTHVDEFRLRSTLD